MKFQGGFSYTPLHITNTPGLGTPPTYIIHTPGVSGNFHGNFWELSWKFPEISRNFPGNFLNFGMWPPPPSEIFKMILHNGNIKIFQSAFRKIILGSCLIHLLNISEMSIWMHLHVYFLPPSHITVFSRSTQTNLLVPQPDSHHISPHRTIAFHYVTSNQTTPHHISPHLYLHFFCFICTTSHHTTPHHIISHHTSSHLTLHRTEIS